MISVNYLGIDMVKMPGTTLKVHRFLFAKPGQKPGRCPYGYDSTSADFTDEERDLTELDLDVTRTLVGRIADALPDAQFVVQIDLSAFPSVLISVDERDPASFAKHDNELLNAYKKSSKTASFPVVCTNHKRKTSAMRIITLSM